MTPLTKRADTHSSTTNPHHTIGSVLYSAIVSGRTHASGAGHRGGPFFVAFVGFSALMARFLWKGRREKVPGDIKTDNPHVGVVVSWLCEWNLSDRMRGTWGHLLSAPPKVYLREQRVHLFL